MRRGGQATGSNPTIHRYLYLLDGRAHGETVAIPPGADRSGVLVPDPVSPKAPPISATIRPPALPERYTALPVEVEILTATIEGDVQISVRLASCTRSKVWPGLVDRNTGKVLEPYAGLLKSAATQIAMGRLRS